MLYNLVASEAESVPKILDKNRAVLFMWRAVEDVRAHLQWFARSTHHYSFAEKMFNTINQLSSSLVDFSTLEKNAKTEITKKKMHDISLIYRRYRELTAEYTDSGGMLSYLIENLKGSQNIKSSSIYVCGFEHLSIQRLAVLQELLKVAKNVTIGVKENSELESQILPILFNKKNVSVISSEVKSSASEKPTISVHKTTQNEAVDVANRVRGLLNDGVSPNDIRILLCDYENSYQIFEQVFAQCNIPVNLDVGVPLVETPMAVFVADCLAIANHDHAETFIPILKSKYLGIDPDDASRIENYCLKRNWGLAKFVSVISKTCSQGERWDNINNVQGLLTEQSEWRNLASEAKRKLESFLIHIKKLSKSKTVGELARATSDLLFSSAEACVISIPAESDGLRLSSTAKSKSDVALDELCLQKFWNLFETFAELLPDKKLDIFEFGNLFATVANAVKVSTIPTFANRVSLINMAEYQPSFVPHLFVANIHDGVFPISQPDTDILTETDIRAMAVTIEPTATMQNTRSRNHCLEILGSYTKFLHLSNIVTNSANEEVAMSEIVEKILAQNPSALCESGEINSRHFAMHRVLTAIGNESAFSDMKYYNSVLQSLDLKDFKIPDLKTNDDNISCGKELFFGENRLGVTTLESFFACPYYNFLTRGLKLKKRPLYKMGSDVLGNLIHKIVEEYTKLLIEKTKDKITEKCVAKIIDDVIKTPEFAYFTLDAQNRPLVSSLKREIRVIIKQIDAHLEQSEFYPKYVEKSLKYKVGDVTLSGKADRVDVKASKVNSVDEVFVIDYKTGSIVDFRLKDLYLGTKLQLPLYLKMLESEKFVPSGAVYFHLKSGLSKENKLKGMTDYSDENLANVIKYSDYMAKQGLSHMGDGVIKCSSGSDKVCRYCPYFALCNEKENLRSCEFDRLKPEDIGGAL